MESITINGVTYSLVAQAPAAAATPAITILHPYGLYRMDGTRVDGYADRARAERRGRQLFPRQGFVIVDATTAEQTVYPGRRG